ncbi:MAG: hypothetical protein ACRD0Q_12290 [Acidimicrobiales bacterium]
MNEPTDTQHPDTEALSALVDGEAPAWSAHVDACLRCRDELAGLRAVRVALGKPVPVPPGVRESAISAALAAYSDESAEPSLSPSVEHAAFRPVPALRPVPEPRFALRRRWLVAGSVVGSVAAMLALVLVAVPLLRNDDRVARKTGADSALRSTARPELSDGAGGVQGEGFAGDRPAAQSAAPELGEVGGPEELKARLGPVANAARQGVAPQLAQTEDDASRNRSAPTAADTTAGAPRACEKAARATVPQPLGTLVYEGIGSSGSIAVVVLAFSTGDAPAPVNLLVLTREGCRPVFSVQYP